jgi:hypothetical protein
MTIEESIGKTKLLEAMPILKSIAKEHNLRLCVAKDFLKAYSILKDKLKTIASIREKNKS